MPDSITPHLADRLDISTDRAQTLLQSMLQELKSRAASEGVHLSELGTFEEEDGRLTFIPSPSLRRRVNHQFEGLSPEDLSGPPSARPDADAPPSLRDDARDEDNASASSTDEPARDEPSPPAGEDDDVPSPTDPNGTDDATVPPEPSKKSAPEAETSSAGERDAPPSSEGSEEQSIPTLDPIEEPTDDDTGPPPNESDSPDDEVSEVDNEAERDEDEEEPSESAAPARPSLIGGALVIALLLGIGWFLISQTSLWSSSPSSQETSEAETTQPVDPESSSDSDASGDNQPERYAGVRPNDTDGESDVGAVDADGSWTVVVASRSSRADAEAMARTFEDQFDSVRVVAGTVNNQTWYRVTVGRYNSEAAAQRVLDANASRMPADAWTHELP